MLEVLCFQPKIILNLHTDNGFEMSESGFNFKYIGGLVPLTIDVIFEIVVDGEDEGNTSY